MPNESKQHDLLTVVTSIIKSKLMLWNLYPFSLGVPRKWSDIFQSPYSKQATFRVLFSRASVWGQRWVAKSEQKSQGLRFTLIFVAYRRKQLTELQFSSVRPLSTFLQCNLDLAHNSRALNNTREVTISMLLIVTLHCVPLLIFFNNSVKSQPISMIFGTLNPAKIWHGHFLERSVHRHLKVYIAASLTDSDGHWLQKSN